MSETKKRVPVWGWIGIGLGVFVLLICTIGMIGAALSGDPEPTAPPPTTAAPVTAPSEDVPTTPSEDVPTTPSDEELASQAPPVKPAVKAPAPKPTIEDGLYHVGEDIPAGTYRLAEAVDNSDFCYWRKSRDAEGEKIIDNDLASTGRLQVTLKAGQWFETNRCGTWVKR